MLAATVFADTAAEADAYSTAFFVLGPERSRAKCARHPALGAILFDQPITGRQLSPVILGQLKVEL